MDKFVMKVLLKEGGFPVIQGARFKKSEGKSNDEIASAVEKDFNYPVIVKPINLGSSVGISKAKDKENLLNSLELAFSYANDIIVEKCIENLKEINCSVLGDEYEAEASFLEEPKMSEEILSYTDKYIGGGKKGGGKTASLKTSSVKSAPMKGAGSKGISDDKRKIPADLPEKQAKKIKDLAVSAFKYLGCLGVCRIDFIIGEDDDKIYINELNTIPGSLSFYLWEPAGLPYKDLLDKMIALAFKRKREEEKVLTSFETNILA
jgi:D-alanine-D-alanine ligase